jgi:hypothetical protein|tara:strand:- start:163 stop:426 length:264 start_codon:yes stop_codon:yes gene_type:complete
LSNNNYIGLDGIQRNREEDEKLSSNMRATFSTPSGKATLKYLRSITIESVNGPIISDHELRHHEGQRYLVGLIERRMNHGEKVRNNV